MSTKNRTTTGTLVLPLQWRAPCRRSALHAGLARDQWMLLQLGRHRDISPVNHLSSPPFPGWACKVPRMELLLAKNRKTEIVIYFIRGARVRCTYSSTSKTPELAEIALGASDEHDGGNCAHAGPRRWSQSGRGHPCKL